MMEFHCRFAGGVNWRVCRAGIEVEKAGVVRVSASSAERCQEFLGRHRSAYILAAKEFAVPVELLVACSLTEAAVKEPERSVRLEPGYVSDEHTPDRVSVGLCQTLISTARSALRNGVIDRAWLLRPENSIRACAAYIARQKPLTGFDPILVACAYNAGGLYEDRSAANRWRLRQFPIGTSRHADRFAEYFNAAMASMNCAEFEIVSFLRLLTEVETVA